MRPAATAFGPLSCLAQFFREGVDSEQLDRYDAMIDSGSYCQWRAVRWPRGTLEGNWDGL